MTTRPKRQPRPVRIPMTGGLHRLFAEQLHVSMAALRMAPHRDHFDAVATILNVVGIALERRADLAVLAATIASGARSMNDIARKVAGIEDGAPLHLRDHELRPIELAVSAADQAVTRLSVNEVDEARRRLAAIRAQEALQKGRP